MSEIRQGSKPIDYVSVDFIKCLAENFKPTFDKICSSSALASLLVKARGMIQVNVDLVNEVAAFDIQLETSPLTASLDILRYGMMLGDSVYQQNRYMFIQSVAEFDDDELLREIKEHWDHPCNRAEFIGRTFPNKAKMSKHPDFITISPPVSNFLDSLLTSVANKNVNTAKIELINILNCLSAILNCSVFTLDRDDADALCLAYDMTYHWPRDENGVLGKGDKNGRGEEPSSFATCRHILIALLLSGGDSSNNGVIAEKNKLKEKRFWNAVRMYKECRQVGEHDIIRCQPAIDAMVALPIYQQAVQFQTILESTVKPEFLAN